MINDTITPDLKRRIDQLSNKAPITEAMGLALVSMAIQAFTRPALRPAPWKSTRKRNAAGQFSGKTLYKHGWLKRSLRVVSHNNSAVTIGSDRPYAAVHQFGTGPYVITPKTAKALFWPGAKHPVKKVNHPGIPARPFFPFEKDGQPTQQAVRRVRAAIRSKLQR